MRGISKVWLPVLVLFPIALFLVAYVLLISDNRFFSNKPDKANELKAVSESWFGSSDVGDSFFGTVKGISGDIISLDVNGHEQWVLLSQETLFSLEECVDKSMDKQEIERMATVDGDVVSAKTCSNLNATASDVMADRAASVLFRRDPDGNFVAERITLFP